MNMLPNQREHRLDLFQPQIHSLPFSHSLKGSFPLCETRTNESQIDYSPIKIIVIKNNVTGAESQT